MSFTFVVAAVVALLFTLASSCLMYQQEPPPQNYMPMYHAVPKNDFVSIEEPVKIPSSRTAPPAPVAMDTSPLLIDSALAFEMNDGHTSASPKNPLSGLPLYINPSFQKDIGISIAAATGSEKINLAIMQRTSSAYWLDVKRKVPVGNDSTTVTAEGILRNAVSMKPVPLVTFIVYNLPNRDCHAKASNGEICCSAKRNPDGTCDYLDDIGECSHGLSDYKTNYINPIAESLRKYCNRVPLALIIEPDSLPNLITNTADKKCGGKATSASYKQGIPYAVNTLAKACPMATIYVDGAHGGWLGWKNNREKFATIIKELGIAPKIRGFSLNVANYQPLGKLCPSLGFCLPGKGNEQHECCKDPCGLSAKYNPGHNEMNYAVELRVSMESVIPGFAPHMLIDTGRNGKNPRSTCANWCNVRDAGCGLLPTTKTDLPNVVDAYMWLKTPGESDGCTEKLPVGGMCRRFDDMCSSKDSIGSQVGEPRAPEAGGWFDYQVKMLARNADFDN